MTSLLLIGTGLIGCSFAMAARRRGLFDRLYGVDRDAAALERAIELGVVDHAAEGARGYDAVCVAVPVRAIPGCVRDAAGRTEAPIFDVGSVKGSVIDALDPVPGNFVPCHPIAGSEAQGPEAARPDLFDNRTVIVTPHAAINPAACETVAGYWRRVGATVVEQSPAAHDEAVALVSHLPHLIAFAFFEMAARRGTLEHVGNGFRDFARIAGADADVWSDILHANAANVRAPLDELIEALRDLGRGLDAEDGSLKRRIEVAADAKRAFDAANPRPKG